MIRVGDNVDTSAVSTKQCEDVTNVAIRVMKLRGMNEDQQSTCKI